MCAIGRAGDTSVCSCSGWVDCDCHACCEGCPDNPEFWCGECWSRKCYDHNIRDLVELLADYENEGRPRSYLEPIIRIIEEWRSKYEKTQG
jgi:hypothetical protein